MPTQNQNRIVGAVGLCTVVVAAFALLAPPRAATPAVTLESELSPAAPGSAAANLAETADTTARSSAAETARLRDEPAPVVWEGEPCDLAVRVRGHDGKPYPGVIVELAPADHPFVCFGKTDKSGTLRATVLARGPQLEVTLALRDGHRELLSLSSVTLRPAATHHATVLVARPPHESRIAQEAAHLESSVDELTSALEGLKSEIRSGRRQAPRSTPAALRSYAPAQFGEYVAFGTHERYGQREFDDHNDLIRVKLRRLERSLDGIEREAGFFGTIRGRLVDHGGEAVAGHVVKVRQLEATRPELYAAVTDDQGEFSIRAKIGPVSCEVLDDTGVVERELNVEMGKTTLWNARIAVAASAYFRFEEGNAPERPSDYALCLRQSSRNFTEVAIHRFGSDGQLRVRSLGGTPASVVLMRQVGRSHVPVADLGPLTAGEHKTLNLATLDAGGALGALQLNGWSEGHTRHAEVLVSPADSSEAAPLSSRHLVTAGADGVGTLRLPVGSWDVRVVEGTHGTGRFRNVETVVGEAVALLTLRPPSVCHLTLTSKEGAGEHVEITRLLDETYSRQFDAPYDFAELGALELDLSPGRYRVRVLDEDDRSLLDDVHQFLPGSRQQLATP